MTTESEALETIYPEAHEKARLASRFQRAHVLITGESGTGKTWLAKKIHELSGCSGDFIEVNCATYSRELFASELFGHKRAAFSGASTDNPGLISAAEEGTLFLDEIAEMDMRLQAFLLKFMDSYGFMRVGSQETVYVKTKVIAATNRNLDLEIEEGRFREDLYNRFRHYLELAPLRNKKPGIPVLLNALWKKLEKEYGYPAKPKDFEDFANELVNSTFDWPKNIRSLEDFLEIAMASSDGKADRLISSIREQLSHAMRKEVTTKMASLESVMTDYFTAEIGARLDGVDSRNFNLHTQQLLGNGMKRAFIRLMESGKTFGDYKCSKVGEILGHGELVRAGKASKALKSAKSSDNPIGKTNARYAFINDALIALGREIDRETLSPFLGENLYQLVMKQVSANLKSN